MHHPHWVTASAGLVLVACSGKTDADYALLCAKLHEADRIRFSALTAAILDRPSLSARTLLEAISEADKELRSRLEEVKKNHPSGYYSMSYQLELQHFDRVNNLIRQHGYGHVAQDFKPE